MPFTSACKAWGQICARGSWSLDARDLTHDGVVAVLEAEKNRGPLSVGLKISLGMWGVRKSASLQRQKLSRYGDWPEGFELSADAEQARGLARDRAARLVAELLKQLPELERRALKAHYWLGLAGAEFVQYMQVPESSAYRFRANALGRMRSMLEERGVVSAALC